MIRIYLATAVAAFAFVGRAANLIQNADLSLDDGMGGVLGWSDMATRIWCLWGALFFSAIHYWLTPWAQQHWGDPDPKHFVLDEIVGYLCVPLLSLPMTAWWQPLAGFCIFRILDAIKLPGARYIDRNIHTASGVLFDDVVSATYTALILSAILWQM